MHDVRLKRILLILLIIQSCLLSGLIGYKIGRMQEQELLLIVEEPVEVAQTIEAENETIVEPEVIEEFYISQEEIELVALVTMAEAEGEPEDGKRLVIDTILNRLDHERFPNTIFDVIYQQEAFTAVWNGRMDRCEVREEYCELVKDELMSRTNTDIVFFRTGRYSSYGKPVMKVGNHYFSSYE